MGKRALLSLALLIMLAPVQPASAELAGAPISGAGSTWAQNAMDQWRRDVFSSPGLTVRYSGVGTSSGRAEFRNGTVDFAVSELEFRPDDPGPADRRFAYLPLLAGGTTFTYNLPAGATRITDLRLSGDTIAKIFTRAITSWDDAAIRAENPGLALPALPIVPVVRSDAAATTLQLTRWLTDRHPEVWTTGPTESFPRIPGIEAKALSTGVVNFVSQAGSAGTITYAESAFVRDAGMPMVRLRNDSGAFVTPDAANVTTALRAAVIRPDRTQDLSGVYRSLDPTAYPLSGYIYAIVPQDTGPPFSAAKG